MCFSDVYTFQSTRAKQDGEWQGKVSAWADGLLFLLLVQANAGEGFHRTNSAPLLHRGPPTSTAGSGQSLPRD